MSSPSSARRSTSSERLVLFPDAFRVPQNILTFEAGRLRDYPFPLSANSNPPTLMPVGILWLFFQRRPERAPHCFHNIPVRTFKHLDTNSFIAACGHPVRREHCNFWLNLSDIAKDLNGQLVTRAARPDDPTGPEDFAVRPRAGTSAMPTAGMASRPPASGPSRTTPRVRRAPATASAATTRIRRAPANASAAATRVRRPQATTRLRSPTLPSASAPVTRGPRLPAPFPMAIPSSSAPAATRSRHAPPGATISVPTVIDLTYEPTLEPPVIDLEFFRSVISPVNEREPTPEPAVPYHRLDWDTGVPALNLFTMLRYCPGCQSVMTARWASTHVCDLTHL